MRTVGVVLFDPTREVLLGLIEGLVLVELPLLLFQAFNLRWKPRCSYCLGMVVGLTHVRDIQVPKHTT